MRHQWKGFLSGILCTVLLLGLIGTVSATVGRKTAELDYADIKVTLDGKAVSLVDANGSPVEPFAINGTTYLPVRAVASALGLNVGWDQETKTVKLTSSTFVEPSLQTVDFTDYTVSVPSYWKRQNLTDGYSLFLAQADVTNDKFAMLYLISSDNFGDLSLADFRERKNEGIDAVKEIASAVLGAPCSTLSQKDILTECGVDGILYTGTLNLPYNNSIHPGVAKIYLLSGKRGSVLFLMSFETSNVDNTYGEELQVVLNSIRFTGTPGNTIPAVPETPVSSSVTATGSGAGFGGTISATIVVTDGKITSCTLTGSNETSSIGGAALAKLESQFVAAGTAEIDGVSGATFTSNGAKKAVAAALSSIRSSAPTSNNSSGDVPDGSSWVYVTTYGKRYHYDSTCNGGSYSLTTLADAKSRGLSPCEKCVLH